MKPIAVVIFFLLTLTAGLMQRASAQDIDPHALFESRCSGCHGHAGEFAREALKMDGDTVVTSRSNVPVAILLERHRGGLSAPEIAVLQPLFRQQLASGGLFEEKCIACHERAREFVRLHLTLRDGNLTGRYSGRDVEEFLAGHGRLSTAEAAIVYGILRDHILTLR